METIPVPVHLLCGTKVNSCECFLIQCRNSAHEPFLCAGNKIAHLQRNKTSCCRKGYVLPFGRMSFWGATVITNLLSSFPSLIEWVSGGYCVHSPTLKRFFIFHFQLPFLLCGFAVLHLF